MKKSFKQQFKQIIFEALERSRYHNGDFMDYADMPALLELCHGKLSAQDHLAILDCQQEWQRLEDTK